MKITPKFFLLCGIIFILSSCFQSSTNEDNVPTQDSEGSGSVVETLTSPTSDFSGEALIADLKDTFDSVDNLESFSAYLDSYTTDVSLVYFVKSQDKERWNTYWMYMYDYFISVDDTQFIENVSKFGSTDTEKKQGFLKFISEMFDTLPISEEKLITEGLDLYYYFNSLPIQKSLGFCSTLLSDTSLIAIQSCIDKAYMFRATKENNLCEMVQNEYNRPFCIAMSDINSSE